LRRQTSYKTEAREGRKCEKDLDGKEKNFRDLMNAKRKKVSRIPPQHKILGGGYSPHRTKL
jgi:hypothetical protein